MLTGFEKEFINTNERISLISEIILKGALRVIRSHEKQSEIKLLQIQRKYKLATCVNFNDHSNEMVNLKTKQNWRNHGINNRNQGNSQPSRIQRNDNASCPGQI